MRARARVVVAAALLGLPAARGGTQAVAPAALRTVQVPAGTPVTVHVMGRNVPCEAYPGTDNLKDDVVVQVDQAVTIDGVVVVPRGGFGLAYVDSSRTTFNRKTQTRIVDSCTFHLIGVYSAGSDLILTVAEPMELRREKDSPVDVRFPVGATYSGKLQAATVKLLR